MTKLSVIPLIAVILLTATHTATAQTPATPSYPKQEWRLGWGDMMYETGVYYNTPTDFKHSYSGHIFGEYQYNLNSWLGVGGEIDWEGVWWTHRDGSFTAPTAERKANYFNLSIMPTVRFTYYRKGIVTMYSGVGLGLNINGGTEIDYKGRQTVCAPVLNITAYGISLNWNPHWFGTFEIGGLNSLNGKQEIFMIGSRLFSISIGYRL